jgi:2,3-bisphosphoglycerate-independent phosphoglycerate mutase
MPEAPTSNSAETNINVTESTRVPHLLLILDGWGHREEKDSNAILLAETPTWDNLWQNRPHTLISASGLDVGLPPGQMGNSEVGHMNLGAGRVVNQDFTRISQAITDGTFFNNLTLLNAINEAKENHAAVHIMGLVSDGGVHSHQNHIKAAITMAFDGGAERVYLHAFLDGRDVPPRSAQASLKLLDEHIKSLGQGGIASIVGRYYAMDRDNRWDRVESAYELLTEATAQYQANTAEEGLMHAYDRDESDEFVKPTSILIDGSRTSINDDDTLIFMNFRADRAREITRAFVAPDFSGFSRNKTPKLASFITLTQYAADIDCPCAFAPESLTNTLGEYVALNRKTQLRIAETEKYAHVTFFFSGGKEALIEGEERILIPSPDVATYDLQPEMSAPELTDKLVDAICSGKFDLIICNYANGDMVGHTGNLKAAIEAVECLDQCLLRITNAIEGVSGHCLITADHGNVEQMSDHKTGQAHTAHTSELVPLVYVGAMAVEFNNAQTGKLSDISPTLLTLMNLPQPPEMSGTSLIRSLDKVSAK